MYSVKNPILKRFAEAVRLFPDETESEQTLKDLVRTLGRAVEKGEASSLPMLDTKLNFANDLTGLHCVIDAGGTQLRFYHVWRPEASLLEIRPFMRKAMPGTGKIELTRAAFLTQLVNALVPLVQEMERFETQQFSEKPFANTTSPLHTTKKTIDVKNLLFTAAPHDSHNNDAHSQVANPPMPPMSPIRIQFSFSYPVEVDEVAEVRPIAFTKNFKARQLLGMPLRQSLEDALKKALKKVNINREIQITILNDTVAVYTVGVLAGIEGWTAKAHSVTISETTFTEGTTSAKASFEIDDVIRIKLQKSMKARPSGPPNVNDGINESLQQKLLAEDHLAENLEQNMQWQDILQKSAQLKAGEPKMIDHVSKKIPSQSSMQGINQASTQAVIGVVYGTGFNICYEDVKLENDVLRWKIFNTEIGCYANLPSGCIDKEVDRSSDNPGAGLAEKHISGAYIGKLYKAALIKLGEMDFAGELTAEVRTFLKGLADADTDQFVSNEALNQFLNTGKLSLFDEKNLSREATQLFRELLTIITCRSAYYAALLTAGVALRIVHRQEVNSIIISLEGGLVENFPNLLRLYKKYLSKWVCSPKIGVRIIRVNQAVPLGSIFVKWESTRI